ncbi:unnamed protein product [Cylindrotheca closterium]|uniref:Transcriptional adapter n=1 Tax=Cylindrotheca closterium TaxID=2856 RepID=A0AAD2CQW2_9STRA|nr:unnamed protein product [Cylindrotheca closterium]
MAKRRKGKHSSGRSTPSSITPPPSAPGSDEEDDTHEQDATKKPDTNDEEMKEASESPRKDKEEPLQKVEGNEIPLVLTSSEKRRGVYECDYCHSDISQLPRIRCAICPDFDLCLDCFSTTDHQAAIARLKAAANTHSELSKDGIQSTMVTGISVSSQNGYPLSQGYKVCDSTRYPMFGPFKHSSIKTADEKDQDQEMSEGEGKSSEDKSAASAPSPLDILTIVDDPKVIWTIEEDLRLLDGIKTHGLGNWTEISEAVSGNGSTGKTPKRCMERYLDDFLGRYGHILPAYTIIDDAVEDEVEAPKETTNDGEESSKPEEEEAVRSSKRRMSSLSRMPSNLSTTSKARKRYRVTRTETLPEYKKLKLKPFLPEVEGVEIGQEVCREQSKRAELEFVKATADASTQEEVDKIKEEWIETRMNRPGAPTVLPPRPSDTALLPGADLLGFMPRRGDFDIEWENDAEESIADMEFTQNDTPQERKLKVQVLEIYFQKQEERERRKNFIMTRKLYDYKKFLEDEEKIPVDERDLVQRLRLFERFHTPDEHKQFIAGIIKAKKLRKEIAKLQMYRRIGIRTLLEAEKYELDKERRQFHKAAQCQKEAEATTKATGAQDPIATSIASTIQATDTKPADTALWKQYKHNDRRGRRSINRTISSLSDGGVTDVSEARGMEENNGEEKKAEESRKEKKDDGKKEEEKKDDKTENEKDSKSMEVDEKDTDVEMKDTEVEIKAPEQDASSKKEKSKNKEQAEFDISASKGYDLLSKREIELCLRLKIFPVQYLEIKKALIFESMRKGLLDNEAAGSARRTIVKVDVEKRGNIIDFLVRAGWISTSLGKAAVSVNN